MKRLHAHSGSCSCTSCVYRSRSKQPSVQQIIEDGSRIDKLYYGKYLPLRERKLLEKLIRTRAVYDDVRNQLISSSGSSDQTRSEHKMKRREDDSTEKNSAVIKLVDLVDRGHIGSSNTSKLNSCCSCCSCSSLRKIKKHMEKHPRVHRHHVPYEDIARYTVEAEKRGRRRRKKLSTKISSKIRAVHFKMKKIRSEPCRCTLSLSSVVTRPSKAYMKKKVQLKEQAIENAQAQKVVKIDRKALKKKICSCSCKIAKLPMKSLKKIKNIRTSTTKDSGTEMRNQRTFRIQKDSLTLFREKLQKKLIYKDWECEPGTCVEDECIPEQCLKKVKAARFRETKRRKYHSRHSGTERDRSRISMSTRPKKVKVIESRVQAGPRPTMGPVVCECKPTTKSVSSMTSFPKTKLLTEIKSTSTELKVKRPKQKPQEKTYKTDRHPPDAIEQKEKKQALPESKLGSVICECKPITKSTHSMTTIVKKQMMQSASKLEIKVKRPVTPKPRQQFEIKEKGYKKSGRQEKEHEKIIVQISPKSNLGHVICECKPSTKTTSSMTNIPKAKASKTMKPKPQPQLLIRETVIQEKTYKKARPKPIKTFKSHEIEQAHAPLKSKIGHVICECRPSTKSTSSMTSVPKSKIKDKRRFSKQEKHYKAGHHKLRREPYKYSYYKNRKESELEEPEKQAVKISSSFKFEIEFSKKRHPALTNKELIEHVKAKRAKRMKPMHSSTKQYRKYQHSKTQFTGALPKASQESYLRESASQTFKPYRRTVLPFPRECEPSMCIPYECDPEKCARILLSRSKSRGRSAMSSTDRLRRKSVGSTTFSQKTSSKSKHIQSKSTESFIRKYKDISKEPPSQIVEKNISAESSHPQKQAVRISSKFSFDIEFYKDKSPDAKADGEKDFLEPQKKIIQKEHRRKYKDRNHGSRNVSSRNNISQSRSSQSFKNIQVGHRLKRCFCTLKLLQRKKQKVKHTVSKKTMASLHVKELEKEARIRQTQTKSSGIAYVVPPVTSTRVSLLPYECEPFFCTPGECNPYECAERIKQRNRRNANRFAKETNTAVTRKKSANTSQPLSKSPSRKVQSSGNRNKKQKARHFYSSKIESKVSSSDKSERQAVRVGSSFSFNIEFSKEKSPPNKSKDTVIINEDLTRKHNHKKDKLKTIGSQPFKRTAYHESIEAKTKLKEKGSYIGSAIKRCFCTLKFHKKEKNAGLQNKNNVISKSTETSYPLPNPQICECKSTSTKISKPRNECDCTPGMCDPYECYEEIKRREIKRLHDRYASTNKYKKKSVMSLTTSEFSGTSKTKSTQSRFLKHTKKKDQKVRVITKEMKPTRSLSPSRQAVRIGSNFSFNIEFSKNRFVPYIQDATNKNRIEKYNAARATASVTKKDKGTKDRRVALKHRPSQANKIRKENKASNVGFLLKRCFCTLGLQKKKISKSDFRRNQPIMTQFVQVVQVDQNRKRFDGHNLTRNSVLNKSLYRGEPLELKLPEGDYLFKENIFGHQNGIKNVYYGPQHLPNSSSFTKRVHFKSRIDFDDYQLGYLLNTQKINPFYQSFYALNVQVSKLKNAPHNNRALEDNECEPGVCVPYECDPLECLKRINNRFKRSKLSETDHLESRSVGCYKKCKLEFQSKATTGANSQNRKSRNGKSQESPMTVGSDLSIRMGAYKDIDPYRNDVIITHNPRQTLRVGSNLRINMAFFKEPNPGSDAVMMTASQTSKYDKDIARRNLRHIGSQVNYDTQDKAIGISHLLTRCFCTAKLNKTQNVAKTDKRKKGGKPEKNKTATEPEKNIKGTKPEKKKKATKPEKNNKSVKLGKNKEVAKREKNKRGAKPENNTKNAKKEKDNDIMANKRISHCGGIDYPKYKSTSSLSKRKQSFKSKTVHSKAKDWSSCSNYCIPKKRQQHKHSFRSSDKHNVTFGSNIHFNMEFFKDRSRNMFSPEMDISKYNQIQRIGYGDERGQNGSIDLVADKCKCKNQAKKNSKGKKIKKDLETVDSILYPNQCEAHTCVHKRRLRSKNTKVDREKYATSVKSAVTNTRAMEAKSGTTSFKECQPYYYKKNLKALEIFKPDVSKTKRKKVTSLTTQNVESNNNLKSSNIDKQKTSVLKKCFCVLTLRISKQVIIKQNEKGTSMNKKTDLNKFMEKCYCALKNMKGNKRLTPKQSTERIGKVNKKEIPKPYLKLEKKGDKTRQAEMETIMPYSKKKFKKLESKTKVAQGATDTTNSRMCPCAKTTGTQNTKTKDKQNTKTKDQSGPEVVMFCPVCKNLSNAKSGKQSLHTCVCTNMDMCLCNEETGDGKKPLKKDLEGLCPVCIAKSSGKYNKKRDRKKMPKLCTCMGDGKQVGKSHAPLQISENLLCLVCKKDNINSQKKIEKDKNNKSGCHKSVCPCCKKTFSIETNKNIKQGMMGKISSVCSSLFNKRKSPPPPPQIKADNTPLFEMLVNTDNMNILNRDEVFKKLGKESKAMKRSRKAIQNGNVDLPLMKVIIDTSSASIVNSDEILKKINYAKRQKGKSLPVSGTTKAASISKTQSERRASKSHGSKCKCCVCSKLKKKKPASPGSPGSALAAKPRKLKPCICGSVICKKDWIKLKKEQMSVKSLKIKPCVCGSDVCREESQKMPELLLEAARHAQRAQDKAKQDIINEKLYQIARKQRKKQYRKEDQRRWKARRKQDRRQMKLIKKNDTAPSLLMVTESLVDFGTFGHNALCDILRSIFRVARHPRDGVYDVKDAIQKPARVAKEVKQSCKGMGLYSTLARFKRRMLKMPVTKSTIAKMESYPVTNYLVHIADKDPRKRMKKFKNRRLREPLDFECSLFMGSLRKRPWLSVYYMCPWFYPHCISLLGIWRQFSDIILFILAVGVWSPCILCMELCRALMCCCLCTG